jgi:hypothetical protein
MEIRLEKFPLMPYLKEEGFEWYFREGFWLCKRAKDDIVIASVVLELRYGKKPLKSQK